MNSRIRKMNSAGMAIGLTLLATRYLNYPAQAADGIFTGYPVNTDYGQVQVRIVIQNNRMVNVIPVTYPNVDPNSQMINARAIPLLIQESIQAQSANIQGVSGASFTSIAWKNSLANAISQWQNTGQTQSNTTNPNRIPQLQQVTDMANSVSGKGTAVEVEINAIADKLNQFMNAMVGKFQSNSSFSSQATFQAVVMQAKQALSGFNNSINQLNNQITALNSVLASATQIMQQINTPTDQYSDTAAQSIEKARAMIAQDISASQVANSYLNLFQSRLTSFLAKGSAVLKSQNALNTVNSNSSSGTGGGAGTLIQRQSSQSNGSSNSGASQSGNFGMPTSAVASDFMNIQNNNQTILVTVGTEYPTTTLTLVANKKGSSSLLTFKVNTDLDGNGSLTIGKNLVGYIWKLEYAGRVLAQASN